MPHAIDATWLPYKLDLVLRRVLWIRMDAAQRAREAFLDERALAADTQGAWMALDAWPADTDAARIDAIFHIGHCGSTLLSRLLATWPEVQALREPLPLRTLADAWPSRDAIDARLSPRDLDALADALWSTWARPLASHTRTVVKATSSCNGFVAPLLQARPETRVVLLDMPLRPYLAALLKSPASSLDALAAAPERLRDLHARGYAADARLHALDVAEQCGLGWLAERVRFDALARLHPDRVLRVDFHALLASKRDTLDTIARHLDLDPAGLDRALMSEAWTRYAKADTHGYTIDDRNHDLALAMRQNAEAIARGVAFVRTHVARVPAIRDAVGAID